jgi:hypothetical protein
MYVSIKELNYETQILSCVSWSACHSLDYLDDDSFCEGFNVQDLESHRQLMPWPLGFAFSSVFPTGGP